jgi:hypothetical protein
MSCTEGFRVSGFLRKTGEWLNKKSSKKWNGLHIWKEVEGSIGRVEGA